MTDSGNGYSQPRFERCIKTLAAIFEKDYGDPPQVERLREHATMTPLLDEMSNC